MYSAVCSLLANLTVSLVSKQAERGIPISFQAENRGVGPKEILQVEEMSFDGGIQDGLRPGF